MTVAHAVEATRDWHADFIENALPRIRRHASAQFSGYKPERKEEAVQDVIANAWKAYRDLRLAGRDPSGYISMIAEFAVKQTRGGRHITGQERARDAMSPRAQRHKGFLMRALPEYDTGQDDAIEGIADTHMASPDVQAQVRIDAHEWRNTLHARDREMLDDMIAGFSTTELKEKYGFSMSAGSQHRRKLHDGLVAYLDGDKGR
ncbi:MAG TPA: hypothetical protein VFE62_01315 [Gemmataceae bacterium]|nr:hypothetical protein [Gemmataceae bacterium]